MFCKDTGFSSFLPGGSNGSEFSFRKLSVLTVNPLALSQNSSGTFPLLQQLQKLGRNRCLGERVP